MKKIHFPMDVQKISWFQNGASLNKSKSPSMSIFYGHLPISQGVKCFIIPIAQI